jgi:hypothetical protein
MACSMAPEFRGCPLRKAGGAPMTSNDSKGFKEGRDNKTGEFVSKKEAERRPKTTSIEVVPKKGHGDTGRYDKGGKKK